MSACSDSVLDRENATDVATGDTSAPTTETPTTSPTTIEAEPTSSSETDADADTEDSAEDRTETTTLDLTGSGCGTELATGQSTVSFEFEDRTRVYELVVPPSYDADVPLPLVMNWHGLGSNGPEQLGFSEYAALAAQEGFLVVAPTGIPSPGQDRNSWELTDEDDPTRDDLAFAEMVCELADRIAGAASVAALAHPDDCEPSRPVPYIGFHGVDDEVVPYAFEYQGCPDGVEAVSYELDNAGHTWPGSSVSLAISEASGLGVTNTDVNATELSWELFSRHSLE